MGEIGNLRPEGTGVIPEQSRPLGGSISCGAAYPVLTRLRLDLSDFG